MRFAMPRLAFVLLILLASCARTYQEGLDLIEGGNAEEGLAKLEQAARENPDRREYRQAYHRQRDLAVQRLLALAETARTQGQWDTAEAAYQRIAKIDPGNARGLAGIQAVRAERSHRVQLSEADELLKKSDRAGAEAKVRGVLAQNANHREAQQLLRRIEERALRAAVAGQQLAPALKQPLSLELRETSLRNVFEAISKSTGLNFVFDKDVRPDLRTTIFVKNSSIEDILRFVLVTNQLERKVLSPNTLLIYPGTPAKQRDYQDLVTKTFYLANAEAKATASMIRALVKTKDMYVDEKLNLVMIRDTPDAIRMAERLVANQDLAEPEVMLEVEVMEVGSNVLHDIGIRYPSAVSFSLVGSGGTAGSFRLSEWHNRSSDLVRVTVSDPFLALNFRNQLDRQNLLANPRIRVKNKDKAKVHIGDKVPVITTTTTSTGFAAESVTYLDVGLKLEVEPTIFLEDEVGIKVGLEVSNIAREIRSASGTLTYQVGTRNAATTLRLKDGETQILAGLISDEDRKTANQVPGLGDLPVLGRLFGSHLDNRNKTEIVLLMTPRIVRNLSRPELRFEEFPSGTESAIGAAPLVLQEVSVSSATPTSAAPAKQPSRLTLQAPSNIPVGQEFTLTVNMETAQALRSGLLDFAFDPSRLKFVRAEPGALVAAADKDASLRTNAPENMGRLNLSFTAKGDIAGAGELARLVFQVSGTAAGAPLVRIEAVSFTSSTGQVVSAQLPPPLNLSLMR
jgi:general secretion pathway protein D